MYLASVHVGANIGLGRQSQLFRLLLRHQQGRAGAVRQVGGVGRGDGAVGLEQISTVCRISEKIILKISTLCRIWDNKVQTVFSP